MKYNQITDEAQDYVCRLYEQEEYPDNMDDVEADTRRAAASGATFPSISPSHRATI